jgi:hypothetical protein
LKTILFIPAFTQRFDFRLPVLVTPRRSFVGWDDIGMSQFGIFRGLKPKPQPRRPDAEGKKPKRLENIVTKAWICDRRFSWKAIVRRNLDVIFLRQQGLA